jgi:hypothetical protein
MDTPRPLRFLHSDDVFNQVKLDVFRRQSSDSIRLALLPGRPGSLKTRPDGTVPMAIIGYSFSLSAARTSMNCHER